MRSSRLLIPCLLGFIAFTLPAHGQEDDSAFFERRVRPVLAQRCYSCHSAAAGKKKGGLVLDGRSSILKGGASGPAVRPGRPEDSLLVQAIRHDDPSLQMPPSGKLPDHEIADIIAWVRQGAVVPETTSVKAGRDQTRKHWAFQPLAESPAPVIKRAAWVRQPIDRWILAELENKGLEPSPEAPPRELLRRVTFDLIGLPPAPEEIDAFERDPASYPQVVERLLASPHYGERWARTWLDLVRYCDRRESWADTGGQPYLYRDWVVQALNEDMPYDRFVRLQLAADQEPTARPGDIAALGFVGLSPSYWKELKLDKNVIRGVVAEEWEERIGTFSATFLGLTVACARCHDHKHDPITMADYYALAGVFASTRETARSLLPPGQIERLAPARAELGRLATSLKEIEKLKTVEAEARRGVLEDDRRWLKGRYPDLDRPLAVAVEDASLHVVADGPHRTKLVYDAGKAQDVAMQMRGNPAQEGPVVPRRFLSVFSKGEPFHQGSGRLELAKALFADASPLTARVMVNRVWKHHFGRGLVDTPSDFGLHGDRPSHPELLEHLARRFIAGGWSLRALHREIVLSSSYRQSSQVSELAAKVDPDNRLLGRMSRRRLDAEAWRDAMLAVTGALDPAVGGAPTDLGDAGNRRRTLYGLVVRRELHDFLRLHDVPDPTTHSANRVPTTTPLQQLFTLNSPMMQRHAELFATRLTKDASDTDSRIRQAYRLAYGRLPTATQIGVARAFLKTEGPADRAWRDFAHVILASNEFQFVD